MEIQRLQYFVDVAKEKSFTRAAKKNFISQSAMSQQITKLESEVEMVLLVRRKQNIELTRQGRLFYQECLELLKHYTDFENNVKILKRRSNENILIGFLTATRMDFLYDIIEDHRLIFPNIKIQLVQCTFGSLRTKLDNGEIDLAISFGHNIKDLRTINIHELTKLKMGILVSKQNELSNKDEICALDLKDEPIVMTSRKFAGRVYDYMLEQRRKEGFVPNIVATADSSETLAMLVSANVGSAYLPEDVSVYNEDRCKMLRIIDNDDYIDYSLAWQKNHSNSALDCLVKMVIQHFETVNATKS